MLRPYSGQLSVGAKHLEDKLSVIAKNSSPNASPVQLLVAENFYLFYITKYKFSDR
jgi:ATP-dependent DNA helicase RecQ